MLVKKNIHTIIITQKQCYNSKIRNEQQQSQANLSHWKWQFQGDFVTGDWGLWLAVDGWLFKFDSDCQKRTPPRLQNYVPINYLFAFKLCGRDGMMNYANQKQTHSHAMNRKQQTGCVGRMTREVPMNYIDVVITIIFCNRNLEADTLMYIEIMNL